MYLLIINVGIWQNFSHFFNFELFFNRQKNFMTMFTLRECLTKTKA